MLFKGDHNLNDKMCLTARYSYGRGDGIPPNLFGKGNPAFTFKYGPTGTRMHQGVVDLTRTETPTLIWTVRYGHTYSSYFRDPMEPFDLITLGFPKYMKDNASHLVFPTLAPEGYTNIGTPGWLIMGRQEGVHHFTGSVTKILGGHNLKFGGEFRQNYLDYLQPGYPSGHFSFGSQVTRRLQNTGSNYEGNSFATMLLGWGTGGQYHIDPKAFARSRYAGMFVQDDWKVTRKLTLNLGLRYEFDIPRWETLNRLSYWDLDAQAPIQVPGFNLRGVYRFVDDNRRSDFKGDYNNFSLRIGFVYALDDKTSIGNYTWSKMIDDSSIGSGNYAWLGGSTAMQNPLNRKLEKSLLAHDIAHRAVLSGAYQLPFGRGRKFNGDANRLLDAFIGGWEVSAFWLLRGGNPLQVSQSGGVLWNGTQRPNLIGDPSTSGRMQDRLNGYFNQSAFSRPDPDTFGTAPRYLNSRGPGIRTLDAALLKNWTTREGQRLEFRLEATNATNTPVFSDPATSYGASNFGQITGTKVGSRNVQLGFKYYF